MRIGIGYDIHRLSAGRKMVLGGVSIPSQKGPEAHSDGDVLIHAVCDAILGALAKGDIGTRFPDTDPKYRDMSSARFLEDVARVMDTEGFRLGNLDGTVITEEIKISSCREKIVSFLSGALKAPESAINLKGKTAEGLGAVGRGEAIAAHAVVLLEEK